jgi:hypothetical protein
MAEEAARRAAGFTEDDCEASPLWNSKMRLRRRLKRR